MGPDHCRQPRPRTRVDWRQRGAVLQHSRSAGLRGRLQRRGVDDNRSSSSGSGGARARRSGSTESHRQYPVCGDYEPRQRLHRPPHRDVFRRRGLRRAATVTWGSQVERVRIASGNGYTSPPTVTFSGGGGTGARGIAEMRQYVYTVTILNGGSGYASAPTVAFSRSQISSSHASGTALVSAGAVTGVSLTTLGSYVHNAPPPTVTFSGGGGSGAAAITKTRLVVIGVIVTSGGVGYTSTPTVTFSPPPPPLPPGHRWFGCPQRGCAPPDVLQVDMIPHSTVRAVTITNAGSGYTLPPTVTFSAPATGTTATGTATLAMKGSPFENLYWARHTLHRQQLRVQVVDQ